MMTMKGAEYSVVLLLIPTLCISCYGSKGGTGEDWDVPTEEGSEDIAVELPDGEEIPADSLQADLVDLDPMDQDPADQDLPDDPVADVRDLLEDDTEDAVEMGGMATCEEVMHESHYCVTILGYDMPLTGLLGLDSGNLCLLNGAAISGRLYEMSIGWIDPFVFTCSSLIGDDPVAGIVRISTLDGSTEIAPHDCLAVTTYNDGILEYTSDGPLLFYPSFEDALDGDYQVLRTSRLGARIIAVQGEILYTPGDEANEIAVFQLPSGESLDPILIDRIIDMWAISVTGDGLLVLYSGMPDDRVAVFDVETGDALWSVYPSTFRFMHMMNGLYCMQGL